MHRHFLGFAQDALLIRGLSAIDAVVLAEFQLSWLHMQPLNVPKIGAALEEDAFYPADYERFRQTFPVAHFVIDEEGYFKSLRRLSGDFDGQDPPNFMDREEYPLRKISGYENLVYACRSEVDLSQPLGPEMAKAACHIYGVKYGELA